MNKKAVVILSGGQDSTTCLYWAKERFNDVRTITFNYGQRHSAEIDSARKISLLANAENRVVNIADGVLLSRSPLTDKDANLETYPDYETMDQIIGNRVELTFVPMRNSLFMTIAANYALYFNAYNLVTGVCQQDNANYPDCRNAFVKALERSINESLGLKDEFKIHTPLMYMNKAETVKLAKALPGCWDALAYSHTCYSGKQPPCGSCHACVLRAHGFQEAGYPDPLVERFKGVTQ